jgi:hypothetical protein
MSDNPPTTEPSALEAGAGFMDQLLQENARKELRRLSLWREMAEQKAQTVITRGTDRGHLKTIIRAKGAPVGEN